MKFLLTLFVAAVAALSCAQDVLHRPSPLAGQTYLTLELFPEVRTEIKATPDENTKVDDLVTKFQGELQDAFGSGDFDAIRATMDKLNAQHDEDVAKLLTADQNARLKQLFVQFNGAGAILNSEIAVELAITDDQKSKVKAAQDAYWVKVHEAFSAGGDPSDALATLVKLHEEMKSTLDKILTDDQRTKLKSMEGTKFEFAKVAAPAH